MAFDAFLFSMCLLIPLIQVVSGRYMWCRPAENRDSLMGYRTARSRRSNEEWRTAQLYYGQLSWKVGWVDLVLSVMTACLLLALFAQGFDQGVVWVILAQCLTFGLMVWMTERFLKQRFPE